MTENNTNEEQHLKTDLERTEPVVEKRDEKMDTGLTESGVGSLDSIKPAQVDSPTTDNDNDVSSGGENGPDSSTDTNASTHTENNKTSTPPQTTTGLSTPPNRNSQVDSEIVTDVKVDDPNTDNPEIEVKETEETPKKRKSNNPNDDLEFPTEIRINPEAQVEQDKLFIKLNDEYKNIESREAESDEDFRNIRKNLVDLKEKAEALFLVAKEEKNSFIDTIQGYFKNINERMEEKQKQRDEEREKVYLEHKERIDATIDEAAKEEHYNTGRKKLISLQNELKGIELPRQRRHEVGEKIQEVFDSINKKQDEHRAQFEAEAANNYAEVKPQIIQAKEEAMNSTEFNNSRKMLIEKQQIIKEAQLTRSQKDELFGEIRKAFNSINEKQDAEKEEFYAESQTNYEKLKPIVQQAINFATDPNNFSSARKKLIDAQNEIKKYRMKLSHKNELFGAIRTIFTKLNETSDSSELDQESLDNYQRLDTKVNEAAMNVRYNTNLNEMRNGLISVRDEVKLTKLTAKHRKELNASIRKAFSEYDKKKEAYFKNRKIRQKKSSGNAAQKIGNEITELEERNVVLKKEIELEKSKMEHLAGDDEKEVIQKTIEEKEKNIKEVSERIATKKAELEKINNQ
jgi:hypothetical protein